VSGLKKAYIYAFIALFLWGIHGPAGRYLAQNNVDMFFVFSFRLWMGTLVFFIFLLAHRGGQNRQFLNLRGSLKNVLLIAGIGLVANTIVFHLALRYLPGTLVMILENLSPIFVLGATFIFYGVRPKIYEIIALLCAFLGILLIVLGKQSFPELSQGFYLGIFLGILTAATFGAYIFLTAHLMSNQKDEPIAVIRYLFTIFLISAIACTPFMVFSKGLPTNAKQWLWLLEMGIFQSGLAYLFWNYALVYIKANTASILFLLTIFFTTVNEVVFLDLRLNIPLVVGGGVIVVSGWLVGRE